MSRTELSGALRDLGQKIPRNQRSKKDLQRLLAKRLAQSQAKTQNVPRNRSSEGLRKVASEGVPVDPRRRRPRLGHPLDPRMPQALADEIRDHRALAVVPDTPLGHPPSQPAVVPLLRKPRLGMLRARWQFVGLKKQLMSVNDTRCEGARTVKKTFEVIKVWKRRSPGPGGCKEYKRVVVTQVQTTYTLANDLSHGAICRDCDIFRGLDAHDIPRAW